MSDGLPEVEFELADLGVACKGRAKKAELREILKPWVEAHPGREVDDGEEPEQGQGSPDTQPMEGRYPLFPDPGGPSKTGSSVYSRNLSLQELKDRRRARKLKLELARNTKEQALALANLEKEQVRAILNRQQALAKRLAMEEKKMAYELGHRELDTQKTPSSSICVIPLARLIRSLGFSVVSYADDTQIIVSVSSNLKKRAERFNISMTQINEWMRINCLKLDPGNRGSLPGQ
ncbi:hypothetical protein NDU88_000588 [Pleurodeles waltl]|uniref:Uncharacterized protein n=1 Tax=Pleurodeles waltl TaxID=8319 RepID=A0AAV7S516_PLEWA|nr:hypothetical protein NDU88_000588 [Pleurodeles waltl]